VSSYQRQSLETVVINNGRSSKGATGSEVWNLNLDQIESGTGRVLAKQIVPVNGLGSSTFSFEAGTVLYSKLRPYLNKVIVADEAGVATTELVPLRCDPEKLLPEYLAYYLRSPEFLGFANVVVAGAKMPRMVMGEFWKHQVPLPPLPEQHRIAAILDQADALRAKRREALAELDQLTQSIFIEMFGDPIENPKGWQWMPLGEIATKFSDGPFGSNLKSEHYVESGVRVIRLQNIGVCEFIDDDRAYISESHFDTIKKHECRPGDVLVGTLGDPNLRACIQPEDIELAINKADCVQIRVNPELATPSFICGLVNNPSTEKLAQALMHGQTRVRISMGSLRNLKLPIPPIAQQMEFDKQCHVVETLKSRFIESQQEEDSLFSSLQHRAFRGEL
jgi:type I restriction enzyme S subunit